MLGTADSVADFIGLIEKATSAVKGRTIGLWYRGVADLRHELVPGLYRSDINDELEREINRDFRLRGAHLLGGAVSDPHLLFIMQHHGAPTRLLDWSEAALVALYFAVFQKRHERNDACVWILDPWSLNQAVINHKSVPVAEYPEITKNYFLPNDHLRVIRKVTGQHCVAIRPPHNSVRISAQKGAFTLHGKDKTPLEKMAVGGKIYLNNIIIPHQSKHTLLEQLRDLGVDHYSLFPDFDGLSYELRARNAP